ncbi:MAG TPA: type II CAAX endopeptidase family protein [Terriglobia bacterium]|nr:type II CAAX endopeptidase family protein [Terriglobia bacterium]
MRPYRLSARAATAAGISVTIAAVAWFWNSTHSFIQAAFVVCPGAAFTVMLLLGSGNVLERLQARIEARPARVMLAPAGLWLLYVVYATGMAIANGMAVITMAAYLSVPFVALWPVRNRPGRVWLEPLVILWLWLPLELGIVRRILITAPGADLHYAFAQLLAIDAGVIAFAVWDRTSYIGYRFEADRRILRTGISNFLIFAAIAIPLGLAIGFISYSFSLPKLYPVPALFAGIFLFTALPEEFLFRGLIQNWIEHATGNQRLSLIVAAVIFGAAHLNNGPPIPNYRYFLMAGIAGIFYGRAWRSTRSLMASSLTHALVDTFWSVFFR